MSAKPFFYFKVKYQFSPRSPDISTRELSLVIKQILSLYGRTKTPSFPLYEVIVSAVSRAMTFSPLTLRIKISLFNLAIDNSFPSMRG